MIKTYNMNYSYNLWGFLRHFTRREDVSDDVQKIAIKINCFLNVMYNGVFENVGNALYVKTQLVWQTTNI